MNARAEKDDFLWKRADDPRSFEKVLALDLAA